MIAVVHWLWSKIVSPLYLFRWYREHLYQRRLRAKPRAKIENTFTIYAHEFGSDATGDGRSLRTAYRTFLRAVRDIPLHVPPGTRYIVDVEGLHKEKLPVTYNVFASDEDERRERDIQRLQKLMTDAEKRVDEEIS